MKIQAMPQSSSLNIQYGIMFASTCKFDSRITRVYNVLQDASH